MAQNWNATKDLVKGADMNLYLFEITSATTISDSGNATNAEVIAYGTNAGLEMNADQLDVTSKMSCRWSANLPGTASYTVSCDALYCLQASAAANSAYTVDDLFENMIAGKNIGWVLAHDVNEGNDDKCGELEGPDTSKPFYWGEAAISSLSITASNGEICSSSISLNGSGRPYKK